MDNTEVKARAGEVLNTLCAHPRLGRYVDPALGIPNVFQGSGEIRLVILGQDPTVENRRTRGNITCVLDLDRNGHLRRYLSEICTQLGIDLERQVYATNLCKNFFTVMPVKLKKEIDLIRETLPFWLPLLKAELEDFPSAPVMTLGNPVLSVLVQAPTIASTSHYWGHRPAWKRGEFGEFSFIEPEENILNRKIFPYPHINSNLHPFYPLRMPGYIEFTKNEIAQ